MAQATPFLITDQDFDQVLIVHLQSVIGEASPGRPISEAHADKALGPAKAAIAFMNVGMAEEPVELLPELWIPSGMVAQMLKLEPFIGADEDTLCELFIQAVMRVLHTRPLTPAAA